MNCRTCKHWGAREFPEHYYPYAEWDDSLPNGGYTRPVPHEVCGLIRLGGEGALKEPAPLAFTQDSSGIAGHLWTAPDFGCVLYEAKDP